MGVVQRQGIKQVIIHLTGVLFGALNTIFIYPLALSLEEIGILQFVLRAAGFFMPFALLANHISAIHFFPVFRDKPSGHHGFWGFLMLSAAITTGAFVLILWWFRVPVSAYYGEKSDLFLQYLGYLLPLLVLMSFSQLISVYTSNFQRIVVPSLFFNLLTKLLLSVLAIGYFFSIIAFEGLFNGLVLTYILVLICLAFYLYWLGEWHWKPEWAFLKKPLRREMGTYFWYNTLFGICFTIATQPDVLMVGTFSALRHVAIYTPGFFIAEAIDAPRKALLTITGPLIAASITEGKMAHVEELYKKTALHQLIMGAGLLACAWLSAGYLFEIMPNGERFSEGKIIILILGLARVADMSFGANYEILNYSPHYRLNFWSVLLTAVLTLLLNWYLIREYSYFGAAYATLFSILFYNILKSGVIFHTFGIHPFSWRTPAVLVAGYLTWWIVGWIPEFASPIVNILVRCSTLLFLYGAVITGARISPDLNHMIVEWSKKWI